MPRGVRAFQEVLVHWNYDRDPLEALRYSEAFAELKTELEKGDQKWLLELLNKRMFNSKHTTFLDLYPDKDYAEQWEQVSKTN